ncbi:MAG: fumarate hydratase [Syntrophomonadaceae bacterium]|nr:fumarate hydratase [Syntrophomonadaceae bacterium]
MRRIQSNDVKERVRQAVLTANTQLPEDVLLALREARLRERSSRAAGILDIILENAHLAETEGIPLCQDTGMVVVEMELGSQLLVEGDLEAAINEGIRTGYQEGYFRASVVRDPLNRINTGDNTPAIIHTHLVPGDGLTINLLPKGAGSENMGQVAMLKPSQGLPGIKDFVLKVVTEAGPNPCPPIVVGVGIGGNMEKAALLAKEALLRPLNQSNPRPDLAVLEKELLGMINATGIGPQGLGGDTTALGVNIEVYPTHIASLPVAVSLSCHATRRIKIEL